MNDSENIRSSEGTAYRTVFVIRSHYSYDDESFSATEAVYSDAKKAYRDCIRRIFEDGEIRHLSSYHIANRLNIKDVDADLREEANETRITECLNAITNLTELKEILQAFNESGTVSTMYNIDEIELTE